MTREPTAGGRRRLRRRRLLAGAAAAAGASTAGCVKRVRNVLGRDGQEQVSLRIKTVPADTDEYAVRIARHLAKRCGEVGIDATVVPMALEELQRQVLLNHDYDVYVGQFHDTRHVDPDQLYALLHSKFSAEPGWQNPFGYADLELDERLETQRRAEPADRRELVAEIQRDVARDQPFAPVVLPETIRTVRRGRFEGWPGYGLDSPLAYLELSSTDDGDGPESEFRGVLTDERVTENLNPLAVEFRRYGTFVGLLYDPLARRYDGRPRPWLADGWRWGGDDEPRLTVTLREDLTWHDGDALTADDVAFTYRFLSDTSLGEAETPVPASRYRDVSTLVADAEAIDGRTVRLRFDRCSRAVARRALRVPILPEHVWSERTGEASIAGIDVNGKMTEAVVWNNPTPVGSGPFEFARRSPKEMLALERYDDHFLWRDADEPVVERFGDPAFDRLSLRVASSDVAAVELVAGGQADATVTDLNAKTVPRIGRADRLELAVSPSRAFYLVGFNIRRAPMANPRFRRALARLVDKAYVADELFDGYARPIASPLAATEWLATDLEFDGRDPVLPFPGTDGDLDRERAREAFEDAGYKYDDDRLVGE